MNKLLVGNHRHAALVTLHAATKHRRDWPSDETAKHPVGSKCVLVLSLNCALIFPWNSLRPRHELTESVGDPGVALEVLLKEIQILAFLLLRWHTRGSEFEDFLDLALLLIVPLVLLRVVIRLSHSEMVSVIVLGRHFVYYYNLINVYPKHHHTLRLLQPLLQ